MRRMPIVIACLLAISTLWGCREEEKLGTANIQTKGRPTMTTHNVMTVISDSGIPQYRLVAPVWYVYDNIDTPLWILPGGPFLEKFDPKFNVVFTVACDSAVNDRLSSEWRLMGNVEYKQEPGMLILTQELIWNQREGTIRSDSFIHLEEPTKIIEGFGFTGKTSSRGDLTEYRLLRPQGMLPYMKPGSGSAQGTPAGATGIPGSPIANPASIPLTMQ